MNNNLDLSGSDQNQSNQSQNIPEEDLEKYLAGKKPDQTSDRLLVQSPVRTSAQPSSQPPVQKPTPVPIPTPTPPPSPPSAPPQTPPQTPTPPPEIEMEPKPISIADDFKPPVEKSSPPNKLVIPPPPAESSAEKLNIDKIEKNAPTEPVKQPSKFKIYLAIIIMLILLIAAGGAGWWYFLAMGTLVFSVQPTDATIKVGDQTAKTSDHLKLKPGDYQVLIEKQDYVSYGKMVTIERLKTTNLQFELKQIPVPEQITLETVKDYYLKGDEIFVLANDGKTLYRLDEPGSQTTDKVQGVETDTNSETTPTDNSAAPETETNSENTQEENTQQNSDINAYTKVAVTPNTLANVEDIIWHPTESLAIFKIKQDKAKLANTPFANSETPDNKIMTWLYDFKRYDLVNQESHFWGNAIGDIVWSPKNSDQVFYYYAPENGEKTLIQASKSNQNLERLVNLKELNIENPHISISPDGNYLAIIPRSKDYNTNCLYLVEILTKKITKIVNEGNNLDAKFSPDSQQILYSTYSKNEVDPMDYSILSVVDVKGTNNKALNIRAPIDKAGFSSDSKNIIVAESKNQTESDVINKINIESKNKTEYEMDSKSYIIKPSKLLFNTEVNYAYFTILNYLYRLELIDSEY